MGKRKIGEKVNIRKNSRYGSASNTVKTITGYVNFGKEQGYRLDNEADNIYLEMDFKKTKPRLT